MIIHLPEDLVSSVRAEVIRGHFGNEQEVVAAAVRDYLMRKHGPTGRKGDAATAGHATVAPEEPGAQELQRRLFEAGILSEIKPPISDLRPYDHRRAVPIQGLPLSETILRERR